MIHTIGLDESEPFGHGSSAEPEHIVYRVLVVDDDVGVQKALERSLRRLGYDVLTASSGEDALRIAIEVHPHVIFSDIRMPQMDGHTLLRRLATLGLDTAVVVVSGSGTIDDVIDVLRSGAIDYLRKPWSPSELVAAVGRGVELHDRRSDARQWQALERGSPPQVPAVVEQAPPPVSTVRVLQPSATLERGTPSSPEATGAATTASSEPRQPGVFDGILDQLRKGDIAWPVFPRILSELRHLLGRPDSAMAEITALVERDPRLSAQVLRISNSTQLARGGRSNDIRSAVGRMGIKHLQSVVLTITASEQYKSPHPSLHALQSKMWRYSIARAVSMRALAEVTSPSLGLERETAYFAGLTVDIGFSFLLAVLGKHLSATAGATLEVEKNSLAFCLQHSELGGAILDRWELDPVIGATARAHHSTEPPHDHSNYWRLIVMATAVAEQLAPDDDLTRTEPLDRALVDRCGAELRIGTSTVAKITEAAQREFDGVISALT